MKFKKHLAKNLSDSEYFIEIIKEKIVSIILITLVVTAFISLILLQLNSNSSFKAKTILDGSRNLNLDSVSNLENVLNSFLVTKNDAKVMKINYFDLYLTTLNKELFFELLDESKFYNQEDFSSEEEYKKKINDLYENNFELDVEKKIIHESKIINSHWSLKFTAPNDKKQKWSESLKILKKKSFSDFKKKVIKFLDNKLLLVNIIIDNDIKEVDDEIDFTLGQQFEYRQKELLKYLNEQASIARELNIDNGLEYITNIVENAEIFNLTDQRGADFLNFQWGYIAIEKKIANILTREKGDAKYFVHDFSNLYKKKNDLQRLKSYYNKLYNDSLKTLPFFYEQDTGIGYMDIYSTEFTSNKINLVVTITLIIVVSLIINSIFIAFTLFNKKR